MARLIAYPYLRPHPDRVRIAPWRHLADPDEKLQQALLDWDPNTLVAAYSRAIVDAAGIRRDCQLDESAELTVLATWYSPGTTLRGSGTVSRVSASPAEQEVPLEVKIPGNLLAGEVRITASITLSASSGGGERSVLAPHTPGNVLWENSVKVLLEGKGSRFPVEVLDFRDIGWAWPGAGWILDWSPDVPDSPLLGNVRLMINNQHRAVTEAVRTRKPTPEQRAILSTIYFDVGRTLVCGILSNEDFVREPDAYAEGTVGYHVHTLLRLHFPEESMTSLQSQMHTHRAFFEGRLQDAFKLFEG